MTELPARTRPPSADAPGPAGGPAARNPWSRRPAPGSASSTARRVATGLLSPLAAIALTAVAPPHPRSRSVVGSPAGRRSGWCWSLPSRAPCWPGPRERTPQWQVAAGAVTAAATLACYRLALHLTGSSRQLAGGGLHGRRARPGRRVHAPGPRAARWPPDPAATGQPGPGQAGPAGPAEPGTQGNHRPRLRRGDRGRRQPRQSGPDSQCRDRRRRVGRRRGDHAAGTAPGVPGVGWPRSRAAPVDRRERRPGEPGLRWPLPCCTCSWHGPLRSPRRPPGAP